MAKTIRSNPQPKKNGLLKFLAAVSDTVKIEQDRVPNTIIVEIVRPVPRKRDAHDVLNY